MLDFESQLTLSIGRRQMRRGESKAKSLKRGGRTRSAAAKTKTRVERKDASAATLVEQLAAKTRELDEALQQQAATTDVLRMISGSAGDLSVVFKAILSNATRICAAKFGTLYLREEDGFRVVAMHNAPPAYSKERMRDVVRPGPGSSLSPRRPNKVAGTG